MPQVRRHSKKEFKPRWSSMNLYEGLWIPPSSQFISSFGRNGLRLFWRRRRLQSISLCIRTTPTIKLEFMWLKIKDSNWEVAAMMEQWLILPLLTTMVKLTRQTAVNSTSLRVTTRLWWKTASKLTIYAVISEEWVRTNSKSSPSKF